MAFSPNNDSNFLTSSDLGIIDAGAGNDRYVLSASQVSANQQITISDNQGLNVLQLAGGLEIVSAKVSNNAIQLTLNNGAVVNVLGASNFNFQTGGNAFDGTGGSIESFANFVTGSLGIAAGLPAPGATPVNAGPVTVDTNGGTNVGGGGVVVPPVGTYTLTSSADTVVEGSSLTFTATRTGDLTAAKTLTFNTTGDTNGGTVNAATPGVDTSPTSGSLTFAAGAATATFTVSASTDTLAEGLEGLKISLFDGTTLAGSKVVLISDDATVTPGQTFPLTEGVDNYPGTAGDDIIIAGEGSVGGNHTLGTSDVINGGAGVDTIEITLAAQTVVPRMTSVEKVFAQSLGLGAGTINMVNATGTQEIWSDNSTDNLSVINLQEKAAIGVKGGNGSNFLVQAAVPALGGDLAVALNAANVGALVVNSGAFAPAYSSVSINAMTGNNAITGKAGLETSQVGFLDAGSKVATVTVTGDGAVRVTAPLVNTVTTIDATANKGGVNFDITGSTKAVTFTGGEGADRINFGGTLSIADKVDGGAGRDVLAVTSQTSVVPGLQVSNVEILELNTLNGTLSAQLLGGVDEVRVTSFLSNGSGTAVVNGLTSNSTFVTNDGGDVRLNITKAEVAGTLDTLNLKTGILGGDNVDVMAGGVETVAYTQNNKAGNFDFTSVNFYDTDGVVDMTKLTIASNADNTVAFNNIVNTVKTVDASAAMGNVFVSITGGNPTNGVSITGGAGDDALSGGDGKDVIIGGAGEDRIDGGDFVVPAMPTADVATYNLSGLTVKIGDTASVTIDGTVYTATATAATPANLAALLAAQIDAGANPVVGSVMAMGSNVVLTAASTGVGSNFGGGAGNVSHTTNAPVAPLATAISTTVPAANATVAKSTLTFDTVSGTYAIGDLVTYNFVDADATTVAVTYTVVAADIVLDGATTAANIANKFSAAIGAAVAPATQVTVVRTGNELEITSNIAGQTVNDSSVSLTALPGNATGTTLAESTNGTDATAQTVSVNFVIPGVTYQPGDVVSLTWNDGAVQTVSYTVLAGNGPAQVAAGLDAAWGIGATADVNTVGGLLSIKDQTAPGVAATITAVSTSIDKAPVTSAPIVPTTVQGNAGSATSIAASDVLTGGDGADLFVFGGQSGGWTGTALANMDTIMDLNLGGASAPTGMDIVQLNSAVLGFAAWNASSLVNAGSAVTMTGPTFAAALQGVFNAGGALDASTNNVGLFTYGADKYLIAANSTVGLDASDIVIKVTGVTGTLDLSDIAIV